MRNQWEFPIDCKVTILKKVTKNENLGEFAIKEVQPDYAYFGSTPVANISSGRRSTALSQVHHG
jgi:hypothetical protein